MNSLKKFYKKWFVIGIPFIVFVSVVMGAGGLNGSGILAAFLFYLCIPIVVYGTFIYFPGKLLKKIKYRKNIESTDVNIGIYQESSSNKGSSKSFEILYIVALVIFAIGIFAVNR